MDEREGPLARPSIAEVAFGAIGALFLLGAIRTFTSTLYMSHFGNVANETIGMIALGVFGSSLLAPVVAWRTSPRRAIAFTATILGGSAVLAIAVRHSALDLVTSAVAVVSGAWWLALFHSGRAPGRVSPLAMALPLALVVDLALRAAFRTVPVGELAAPVAIGLAGAGGLAFLGVGIVALGAEREWTSPGLRGALGLLALPPLLVVAETATTNAAQVAGAAAIGLGPEPARSPSVAMLAIGMGLAAGLFLLGRPGLRRMYAAAALGLGALLLWSRIPFVPLLGGAVAAAGTLLGVGVLTSSPPRPSRSPILAAAALGLGWILFVAVAFGFYAYYALAAAAWAATLLVVIALLAVAPSPPAIPSRTLAALMAALAVLAPLLALIATPDPAVTEPPRTFRLMTYNVHQGFSEANVAALDEIAATIARESPDVVVLQEVVRGWMIGEQHDVLAVLSDRLAMPYVFGPAIGETYGNAVLARFPMTQVRYVRYPREPAIRHQPRGAIVLRVAGVTLIATHLDHIAEASRVRQEQVRAILDAWAGATPAVVAGDLNALPGSAELELLRSAGFTDLAAAAGADQPTSPSAVPRDRVDYVWGIGVTGSQAYIVASTASDHRPVVVNVTVGGR